MYSCDPIYVPAVSGKNHTEAAAVMLIIPNEIAISSMEMDEMTK